jgi:prevent-host-death family protein
MRVMAKTITLREANQAFSRVVREVEAGEEFTITRNGEPVARLVPVRRERVLTPEQEAARARTRARARMEQGWHLGGERFNRDEIYDEIVERYDAKRRR